MIQPTIYSYAVLDILRMWYLPRFTNAQPVDWTRIAHQCGYYDQAHFNKDFRAFTGQNPTDYLRLRRQVCAENPEQKRLYRNLPIV